jgi:transposase
MDAPTRDGIGVPKRSCVSTASQTGAPIIKATTIGIDLAKNLFQLHGIDGHGKVVLKRQIKREQMAAFFVNLPSALIGIACEAKMP